MGASEEIARPTYLVDFIDQVLVACPQCGRVATVLAKGALRAQSPAIRCANCGFNRTGWPAPDGVILDAVARRRCPRCGRWLERRYQRLSGKHGEVIISCPCKAQTTVAIKFTSVRLGEPCDPYFGYPLWLQKAIGHDVLWAYNRRHLTFLKDFVRAGIRPRSRHANGSLASRLPSWIAKGTRRANVLKHLETLARRSA
jgi:predicted RNA-binding Zn-ribbon protein involved in translation (DUF1610 family)